MLPPESQEVVRRGEAIYEQRLRGQLEPARHGQFVSIEPDSGDYFLGQTLDEAIAAARQAYPDRLSYTCRIGYPAAVQIGACS